MIKLVVSGQIRTFIVQALFYCTQQSFQIPAFVPPDSPSPHEQIDLSEANKATEVDVKAVDLTAVSQSDLAEPLIDGGVIVSALSDKALESQKLIQDADEGQISFPDGFGFFIMGMQGAGRSRWSVGEKA